MQIEEFNDFIEVRSKRKKNVKDSQTELRLKLNENNNNKDEGISSASPTESDQGALDLKSVPAASKKPKNKKKRKKSKSSKTCGYEASPEEEKRDETFYDQYLVQITRAKPDNDDIKQHRRRRISSRGDNEDEPYKTIHWAPELVLEPSRVRTSSAGSILSKGNNWAESSYECDCGVPGCTCYMEGSNRPKWLSRSLRWKPRYSALSSMRLDELNTIDDKFHYCDKQTHLKLGSGRTVYFGLMASDGKEVAVRKLKTKQLPQLRPSLIRSLLALRHPNLLRYDQFCILKNQTYILQELIDYSLGRWLRDPAVVVQPIEKVDVCRQLVTGVKYLHDKKICHTDLRPANVLITQVGRVVIGNYAVAPMNTENKNKSIPKRVSEMKTSSPELWRAYETIWEISDNFEPHSDIPPLGMVLFTIITKGKHPYGLTGRKESAPDAMKNMLMPKYCLNEINDILAKELIRPMLNKDPSSRPTLKEIQNAPYFWSNQQKIEHVKFVLRGPRAESIEKKHGRMLIPSVGHFGDMPELLAVCREANSGEEALDMLANEYMANPFDKDPFLQEIVDSWPILIELTKQYGVKFDSDESSDQDTIGSLEESLD